MKMSNSGLPQANYIQKTIKFGKIVIRSEKPNQSFSDAKKGLSSLEKAARHRVFVANEADE